MDNWILSGNKVVIDNIVIGKDPGRFLGQAYSQYNVIMGYQAGYGVEGSFSTTQLILMFVLGIKQVMVSQQVIKML